jgi:hypothetical protein
MLSSGSEQEYCDIMQKDQNLWVREMSENYALLGNIKHKSLAVAYTHSSWVTVGVIVLP